jgi:arginyl-tRNA synthetase
VVELARVETAKRHTDWTEVEIKNTAEKIALAAIKFAMIRTSRKNPIVFDVNEAVSFDGFTGPYLQYTVTRINSILRHEAAKQFKDVDSTQLTQPQEKELLLLLSQFPEVVSQSAVDFEPSHLAQYLFDLSHVFAGYYENVSILRADDKTRQARLALIVGVRQVLANGVVILGIEILERM